MNAATRDAFPEEAAIISAARRFAESLAEKSTSAGETWHGILAQGWLEMLLAPETTAPVRTLCALSVELGRIARSSPLAETAAPILALRRKRNPSVSCSGDSSALKAILDTGSALAVAIPGEGSERRRESLRFEDGRARGEFFNVEHFEVAGALCLADLHSDRLLWCSLPSTAIAATAAQGFGPAWHDLRLNELAMHALDSAGAAGWLHDVLRLAAVARAWGAAQRSLEELIAHTLVREQFGQVIGRFQSMQHRLANLRIVLDAARGLLERAVGTLDEGAPDARLHIATLCSYAGEALPQFALDCHHGFGAVGYMEEHGMPLRFRYIHADLARHARPAHAATTLGRHLLEHDDGPSYVSRRVPLPPSTERFRSELAAWLDGQLDGQKSTEPRTANDGKSSIRSFDRGFLEAIGHRGYIGVTIDRQHGGLGYGPLEQFAFDEEIQFRDAPYYGFAAVQALAAAIARYGTPTQRARYLPLMLGGKAVFCLGYSEPNAGSDLAAIRTRAERRGEDWIINGQKIWTSLGTVGDYLWLVARTGEVTSRHKGLSIFIVPMTVPGLTIRPLNAMNGEAPCALFMDDIRLPADALIGEVDGGWSVITYALAQERMLMGSFGSRLALRMSRAIEELRRCSSAPSASAATQIEIGRVAARVEASRWLAHEASVSATRGDATVEAAISKVFASELHEQLAEAVIRWFGADVLLSPPSAGTVLAGSIGYELSMGIMYVVGGGSNDIQRNIIAQRGLGLPR